MKKFVIINFLSLILLLTNNNCFGQNPINRKTPGVYVQEVNGLPQSIAEVATAIPAFIGYTEKGKNLLFVPKKISSMLEYQNYFGVASTSESFVLYPSLQLYFNNGGGDCYIVSIGNYKNQEVSNFIAGLKAISKETEPTLLVFPDAVNLPGNDLYTVQKEALQQAATLKDRFCILDLKFASTATEHTNVVTEFRNNIGASNLKYGAAYTPFLNSKTKLNLPPSAVVAAAYCVTDKTQGVWKAPANVSLRNVLGLAYNLSSTEQTTLNVDAKTGKSVNVIRNFTGRGTLIWGARTLAGNDNEWRYISVRRFCTMVEESITNSIQSFVFEPNDANTWVKVKSTIENYLTLKWRDGALVGSKPEQAFFVNVGLGKTMTSQDLLDKKMIIEYGLSTIRPAEFIVSKIVLKMAN